MTTDKTLLPCPFCGGEAERIDFDVGSGDNEGGSCISCTKCQASGPVEFGYKENFVSNWNRRAAIALMRAPVGEVSDAMLERALDAMRQGQYEGDQFRDSMRRALRAAMQQTETK